MSDTAEKQPTLVDSGNDSGGSWEIWRGRPPVDRHRFGNPLMTELKEGEYKGCYLLEWLW
jgi:hypothetical protein